MAIKRNLQIILLKQKDKLGKKITEERETKITINEYKSAINKLSFKIINF